MKKLSLMIAIIPLLFFTPACTKPFTPQPPDPANQCDVTMLQTGFETISPDQFIMNGSTADTFRIGGTKGLGSTTLQYMVPLYFATKEIPFKAGKVTATITHAHFWAEYGNTTITISLVNTQRQYQLNVINVTKPGTYTDMVGGNLRIEAGNYSIQLAVITDQRTPRKISLDDFIVTANGDCK